MTATTFGTSTLNRFKRAVIAAVSEELVSLSSPSVVPLLETYIRDDVVAAVDQDVFSDTAAVPGLRPAGILDGAPTRATVGPDFQSIISDVKWLRSQLAEVLRMPMLIMNSEHLRGLASGLDTSGDRFPFKADVEAGRLLGYPIRHSPWVLKGSLIMLDAATLAHAVDLSEFDQSSEAAIVMVDNAPPAPTMGDATKGTVDVGDSIQVSDEPVRPPRAL